MRLLQVLGLALAGTFVASWASAQTVEQRAEPSSSQSAETPTITWEVERRFRLWGDGDEVQQRNLEGLYGQLAGEPPADSAHNAIVSFLRAHPDLWSKVPWDEVAEGYRQTYVFPDRYSILIGLAAKAALAGATCSWRSSVGSIPAETLPCANAVHLNLPAERAGGSRRVDITVVITRADGASTAVTQSMQVKDRLIVSMGDSFASGEGNPDIPANLGALAAGPGVNDTGADTWLGTATVGVKMAHWAEPVCHRSFYNQHLVAALKLAADRPHEAVTFMSYACSGAGVFDGLLAPQDGPPGVKDNPRAANPKFAQVEAMGRDLCLPTATGSRFLEISAISSRPVMEWDRIVGGYIGGENASSAVAFHCRAGRRKPDAVLLSIGGNDVFFARIIMGVMLPKWLPGWWANRVLGTARHFLAKENYESVAAQSLILRPELSSLKARLDTIAGGAAVIQSSYPLPTRGAGGRKCGPDKDPPPPTDVPVLRRLAAPRGIWANVGGMFHLDWSMSISVDDEDDVETQVVGGLNSILQTNAERSGWVYVDRYLPNFEGHGWCAGDGIVEQADLPRWDPTTRSWANWNPSKWDPYVLRSRYFRTPNDSALTEMQELARQADLHIIRKRQFILMNSLAGSFHPTFQAHVIMGLAVGAELRTALPAD